MRYTIYLFLFFILTSCHRQVNHFAYNDVRSHRFDNRITDVDSAVINMIQPYKVTLDVKMNEVIGYNNKELVKGKPSSTLTNWACDAVMNGYQNMTGKKVDVVLQNYGGIRINAFGAGDVTVGKIYEIMPFENYFVVLEANGDITQQIFDKAAHLGGWPISHNSSFVIKDSMATNIVIDGKPFDKNKTYYIGLPDYIANGGDECQFLKTVKREETGILVRDLLIYDVKRIKTISPNNEQRITITK